MNQSLLIRWSPMSGTLAVGLWVLGMIFVTGFGYMTSPEKVLERFVSNPARIQLGALLAGYLAPFFLIWFAGSLYDTLQAHEGDIGPLPTIVFGGAIVCSISIAIGYSIIWVAATRAGKPVGFSLEYALVMNDLYSVLVGNLFSIGLAVFIGATGIASLRTGLFPDWLGWTSVVFGVGLLTPVHWVFEGLSTIWLVVVSILLLQLGN